MRPINQRRAGWLSNVINDYVAGKDESGTEEEEEQKKKGRSSVVSKSKHVLLFVTAADLSRSRRGRKKTNLFNAFKISRTLQE